MSTNIGEEYKLTESLLKDEVGGSPVIAPNTDSYGTIIPEHTKMDLKKQGKKYNFPKTMKIISRELGFFRDDENGWVHFDPEKMERREVDKTDDIIPQAFDVLGDQLMEYDPKTKKWSDIPESRLLKRKKYIDYAKFKFDPHADPFVYDPIDRKWTINLYKKSDFENKFENGEIQDMSTPTIDILLENIFQTKENSDYFKNWFAFILQKKEKTGVAIVVIGKPGVGKGTLFREIMSYGVGKTNSTTVDQEDIGSRYGSYDLEKAILVNGDEIKMDYREGNSGYETLKKWITEPEIRVEGKFMNRILVENHMNLFFSSNNQVPLQIQPGDRRYTVIEPKEVTIIEICSNMGISREEFIGRLRDERDSFLAGLMRMDIDIERARTCLDSEKKDSLIEATTPKIDLLVQKIKNIFNDDNFFLLNLAENLALCRYNFEIKKYIMGVNMLNSTTDDIMVHVVSEVKNQITELGGVESSILVFLYRTYINPRENPTKIGIELGKYFGRTTSKMYQNRKINFRKFLNFTSFGLPF